MSIKLYYTSVLNETRAKTFGDNELTAVLAEAEVLRKSGATHVCISSELSGSVGKAGVTAVENGKTPDGQDYTWMKRRTS